MLLIRSISNLIVPRSTNDDLRRREFIVNVILCGSITLSAFALLRVVIDSMKYGAQYSGAPPVALLVVFIFFLSLFVLSRKGLFIYSAYLLTALYLLSITFTAYAFGVELPAALSGYALIIIISGILISTKFTFIATIVISLILLLLSHMQINGISNPSLYWKSEALFINDTLSYIVIFWVIALISWLSNREIERSLIRARRSEKELMKERDSLEAKVEERTRELKQAQYEKMVQIAQMAEFGRLASGIFHDLSNPLTALSLNLEHLHSMAKLKDQDASDLSSNESAIREAIRAKKRMEELVKAVQQQTKKQEIKEEFSMKSEIKKSIGLLSSKAMASRVSVELNAKNEIRILGNPLRFSQLVTNLLSNAIDAYDPDDNHTRKVAVSLKSVDGQACLSVKDWGRGIEPENIGKIFEPFFTTKDAREGTGLGLSIARDVVEKGFGGRISVQSSPKGGTEFVIFIPINDPNK
ncbi:MAG: Sensor histidine kinase TmoS [bacterium ADurb.Bin400]|nr:MAG: Sensor histidine kinase TmoS [bacterium ADurb.Bin400]